ncbi:hypothetical protein ACFL27_19525 [candidate division CSSED10-310 bacterium]|uniref:Uncharacterized protein n=1 Tax=candidate division CSSED10-310 bacterium TaxID=2855610 RepID=A0ABV6Z1R1_UNCC1
MVSVNRNLMIVMNLFLIGLHFMSGCNEYNEDIDTELTDISAFVVTTDFQTGSFSTITLGSPHVLTSDIDTICPDAISRSWNGLIYIVGRYSCDSIQVLNPSENFSLFSEYSVGAGTNPQDIVVIKQEKAYISRLAAPQLLVVSPNSGQVLKEIDLSEYADADGLPELYTMYYLEDYHLLFIAVQRLDTTTYLNVAPSYVIVLNTETDEIEKVITLESINPFTEFIFVEESEKLLIGCNGLYGALDGGIEVIDILSLESEGLLVNESNLGGDILDFDYRKNIGYVLISDLEFNTRVLTIDMETGAIGAPLLETAGFFLNNVAINDRDELWILDRSPLLSGIHIFDALDRSFLEKINLSGLPPFWISFIAE